MGWSIGNIKNDVILSKKCQEELKEWAREEWGCEDPMIVYQDKLYFNIDHGEHMDYIQEVGVQNILKTNKVKGNICFGSLEGDNANTFWGYSFDGKGNMFDLIGCVTYYDEENGEVIYT